MTTIAPPRPDVDELEQRATDQDAVCHLFDANAGQALCGASVKAAGLPLSYAGPDPAASPCSGGCGRNRCAACAAEYTMRPAATDATSGGGGLMSRWVDVRILNGEAGRAVTLLGAALGPVNMRINTDPPSAAPGVEWELSIEGHGEAGITDLLRGWGITVLAVRERLDAPLTIAEARR